MPDDKKQDAKTSCDATQWHEVVKGDTLSKIAEKYYGDPGL
jgi:nucleoid-associated protein YgaU